LSDPIAGMDADHARMQGRYRQYLTRCNEHRFEELGEFLAPDAAVNGESVGLRGYIDGLAELTETYPDFHWEIEHLVVEEGWLSAHLTDTATDRDGRRICIQEFALYRFDDDRIAATWGDLDRWRLDAAPDAGP
jgi:predicted ester cyclase